METTTRGGTGLAIPVLVLVSGIVATIGAFLGSGVLGGTPIQFAAGGWLNEDSTPLAPAKGAFRIWSLIYLGLLAYSVWQLLPAQRRSARQQGLRADPDGGPDDAAEKRHRPRLHQVRREHLPAGRAQAAQDADGPPP